MPEATFLEQLRARGIPPKEAPSFLELPEKVQAAIAPPPPPPPVAPPLEPEAPPRPVVRDGVVPPPVATKPALSPEELEDLRVRLRALLAEPHIADRQRRP